MHSDLDPNLHIANLHSSGNERMNIFMHFTAFSILLPLIEPEQSTIKTYSEFDTLFASNDGNAEMPESIQFTEITFPLENGVIPAGGITMTGANGVSAYIPDTVKLADGATELKLTVTPLEELPFTFIFSTKPLYSLPITASAFIITS